MLWFERAKKLAKHKEITYQHIADQLGITTGAVGHYLNGRREPSVADFAKLAKLLGVSMEALYSGFDESKHDLVSAINSLTIEHQADIRAALRVFAAAEREGK